ncbi:MAG: transcription antitermination factor NusB [Anaerovoracaceae bacterium]
MTRVEAREILMQAVFQMDAQQDQSEELLELFIKEKKPGVKQGAYIRESFEEIKKNLESLDETINKFSTNWKTNRMPKTDLAILRVAVYELIHNEEVPSAVTINEAVNMAKKFGGAESKKFINGILGNLERSR